MQLFNDIKRLSFRHKNNKFTYYVSAYFREFYPRVWCRSRLERLVEQFNKLLPADQEYIRTRVDYYNKLSKLTSLSDTVKPISTLKLGTTMKVYYFDTFEYIRFFNPQLKASCVFGDVTFVPGEPGIVKSRPIHGDNSNSVLLKLVKLRHFLFLNDRIPFRKKKNMLVSRGKANDKPHRMKFLEMYYQHPLCDIGQVDHEEHLTYPTHRLTLSEQLHYKFILCLEGNDVASNLKWVMSSNSLAVMPLPKYETWFMEGTLVPDYHYVRIKDDYSNLEERLNYYIEHSEEAEKIIENAHRHVAQFKNKKREKLISLLVLKKYFEKTNQTV